MELIWNLVAIAGFICWLILLIEAFKDSVLKGILGLFCQIYMVWFGLVESKNENRIWMTIVMAIGLFGWFSIIKR